jgi:hypothetical protein
MADTSTALKEIFDEMFTLLEDLETRNVAVLEYLREQGGVTAERLAPYLDRAGAASNVKWRAARVRMEYLLAPAPKSTTEQGKDEKSKGSQALTKEKESEDGGAKAEDGKERGKKAESKELGKELATAELGAKKPDAERSGEAKVDKAQSAKPAADEKAKDKEQDGAKKGQDAERESSGAEAQTSALVGEKKSDSRKGENEKNQAPQTQKAAKAQ